MLNAVKNLATKSLNITGSNNKVEHIQCVTAHVAQSDNQLIDCEVVAENDDHTGEDAKQEELDNQPQREELEPDDAVE